MGSLPAVSPVQPRIIVGGLQAGPEAMPTPAVILSYPDEGSALQAAKILLAVQNGAKPFSTGPDIYVGDTNIKVEFWNAGSGKSRNTVCAIWAKGDNRHLTCSFCAQGAVDQGMVEVFQQLMDVHRSYAINVACGERVLPAIDVVKYTVEERRIRDQITVRHS